MYNIGYEYWHKFFLVQPLEYLKANLFCKTTFLILVFVQY